MNGDFDTITKSIESQDFQFIANQAAGLTMFRRIVQEQPIFQELEQYASDDTGASDVIERVNDLLSLDTDPRYENPYDTALATYLLALHNMKRTEAIQAIEHFLLENQLWWARKLAEQVLKETEVLPDAIVIHAAVTGSMGLLHSMNRVLLSVGEIQRESSGNTTATMQVFSKIKRHFETSNIECHMFNWETFGKVRIKLNDTTADDSSETTKALQNPTIEPAIIKVAS